jgi:hypothetical protein
MDMKDLLSVIDNLQQEKQPEIVTESTNRLSQYIEMIAESKVDEKISFHHTGNRSSMKKHLKQSHGLTKSIRSSSSKGAKHFLKNDANPTDIISMDVPLLIRLLEYAREDANTDMDLHNVAEQLINLSKDGNTLTMDNYDSIVGGNSEEPSDM